MLKIYLDTNVWGRPFDAPSQRIINETNAFFKILERGFEGELTIVGSVVLDVEVGNMEEVEKKTAIEQLLALLVSEKIYDVSISKLKEIKLMGLKLPDASHIACTITGECKYFISCDDDVLRKGKEIEKRYGIRVCGPVEFIKMEEEKW
ncbi:MAG: PIN domain-containing protein [Methanosarcinales archaeon Met12]|nr:MAG: PIN domain-containing protein [Methanosarcinales archaeon Met12]